jgi:hypothetical protein
MLKEIALPKKEGSSRRQENFPKGASRLLLTQYRWGGSHEAG